MGDTRQEDRDLTDLEILQIRVDNLEQQRIGRMDDFENELSIFKNRFERELSEFEDVVTSLSEEDVGILERLERLEERTINSNDINRIQPTLDTHTDRFKSLETRLNELEQRLNSSPIQSQRRLQTTWTPTWTLRTPTWTRGFEI